MSDGKLRKYIVYSIGEILLVVIGILLAVQINNWNQNRSTQKKELQALKDLRREFNLNESRISKKQELRKTLAPQFEKYINSIRNQQSSYKSFQEFHSRELLHGMTNPSTGVINALISSSDISIITNDSLKYLLAGWNNQLENLYENEEILWNVGLGFTETASDKLPDPRYTWPDWDDKKAESISKELFQNISYRNNLVGFASCNEIVIDECNTILTDLKRIQSILENEIRSNK